jgi:hypothetical protein
MIGVHLRRHEQVGGGWRWLMLASLGVVPWLIAEAGWGQTAIRSGDPVPRDVREIYDAGCRYLAREQDPSGSWKDTQEGPGVTGMAMMVLLASGEDPNHGAYARNVRRALRSIIRTQDRDTGFYGGSGHSGMYQHGFAMLAMAEAYGAVDDRTLWAEEGGDGGESGGGKGLSTGESLELAVKLAVTSARKNPVGAWRYSPDATDHDTSVSGAILMGLLGARNAGIEVPDETIDKAIQYFVSMTTPDGAVGYAGPGGGSDATTSIGCLVMAIARRKDLPEFRRVADALAERSRAPERDGYPNYTRYYRAQALFQSDVEVWRQWNDQLIRELKSQRTSAGMLATGGGGDGGQIAGTSLSLLALAVNFRFLPIYER